MICEKTEADCVSAEELKAWGEARRRWRENVRVHNIKLSHRFADAVLSGEKPFEVRYNDRGYQKGDVVTFTVVDDCSVKIAHELDGKEFIITYVLSGWGIKEDWCAFGLMRL